VTDPKWIKTVGGPRADDPRNGEMHQLFEDVPSQRFTLEPWEGQTDAEDAVYDLASAEPVIDDEGRTVWIYNYVGLASEIYGVFEEYDDET
jgi:hypothetical protein